MQQSPIEIQKVDLSVTAETLTLDTPNADNNAVPTALDLSVIVISYNTREMTLSCLRALYAGLGNLKAEVFVIDNASTDGSAVAVRAAFPAAQVIENSGNAGFGAANNQAMLLASGEYFLLLNSDAFVEPEAVSALVSYGRAHPEIGAAGPRLLNGDGTLQLSCFRYPSPLGVWLEQLWVSALFPNHPVLGYYRRWGHDRERLVDFVIGACLLVRRETYAQVGGFDDSFFMYQEETDWQRRMHNRGWKIGFTPDALVTHLGGASGASEKAKISGHFFDSMDHYLHKHYGLAGLLSLRFSMLIGCFLRLLLWVGVFLGSPRRREVAQSKIRLMAWLCVRQVTHWRFSGNSTSL